MSLKVAIQMDPMEHINTSGDSTFVLALEAQRRGYTLHHYLPKDLTLHKGKVTARARKLGVSRQKTDSYTYGEWEVIDLQNIDIVLMRQDPPFDMAYIAATHILEHIQPGTLVLNDPAHVRNAPEKLFVTHYPDLMPPTLITSNREEIAAFRKEYKDIVIKPLFGNGGAQVFHIAPDDDNLNALLEMFTQQSREPIIIQKYLPEVRIGDKRIVLVDGKPAGAVLRVPAKGEARANLHVGGKPEKTTLTKREREICEAIGPELSRRGLVFTGIDVIGDYLTEINVTSPTGLQEINRLDDTCLEAQLWDAFESRLSV